MKVFLDEAIAPLQTGYVTDLSLNHDLGPHRIGATEARAPRRRNRSWVSPDPAEERFQGTDLRRSRPRWFEDPNP